MYEYNKPVQNSHITQARQAARSNAESSNKLLQNLQPSGMQNELNIKQLMEELVLKSRLLDQFNIENQLRKHAAPTNALESVANQLPLEESSQLQPNLKDVQIENSAVENFLEQALRNITLKEAENRKDFQLKYLEGLRFVWHILRRFYPMLFYFHFKCSVFTLQEVE